MICLTCLMMTGGAEQPPMVPTNLTSLPSEAREQFPPADVLDVGRVPGHKEDMAVGSGGVL